jgi:hypothetical protein
MNDLNSDENSDLIPAIHPDERASELTVAELVGHVYACAPVTERSRMIEQLMRPLGVLSLVAVAHGVFAKIRFRGSWPELLVRPEDARLRSLYSGGPSTTRGHHSV